MSDDILVPQSDSEIFLATMTGDYAGELPVPDSRVEKYLKKLVEQGSVDPSIAITDAQIDALFN